MGGASLPRFLRTWLGVFTVVWGLHMVSVCMAQAETSSPGSAPASSGASASASGSATAATTDEQAAIRASLIDWYTTNFYENETQLLGIPNNRTDGLPQNEKPCAQLPSLQTRSSSVKANGQCPPKYTNLSCTCILGYIRTGRNEFWEFKVKKKTSMTTFPLTLDAADVLEVDAIATIWAPGTLKGLKINGTSSEPLPINFISDTRSDQSANHVIAASESTTFNLQSVTMQNCNLQTWGYGFAVAMGNVQYLYLGQNKYLNYTISPAVFQAIRSLTEFKADGVPSGTTCMNGELQTAHDVTFCVLGTSSTAVLLFFVIRNKWRKSRHESFKEEHGSVFVDTLDFEDSHSTLNAQLLNDPLIITNRIPYRELKVSHCINKGGFGLVFVGEYQGRKVAVKKIRSDMSSDIEQIELFLKEITLMATLVHPRIVEFIGVAWDSLRHLSAVTEFMERGDLRDVLHGFKTRGCQLTWETHKTHISLHIAEALTYLHSLRPKKVIHRDLKSKNVLMTADLEAKLSDFGISRERRYEDTHMTAGIGTSFWIAPEVLMGKDYDEKADIFSFGVVLSEIDTDDYPYWNEKNPQQGGKLQQNEILRQVALGAIRPEFTEDCPEAILELADRCLQVNPDDRPTSSEIVCEIQQILQVSSRSSSSRKSIAI
ncbi:Tkl protein kinase, partial [Globisporangium splendens]